jgi:hypothetical protein
MKDRKIIFIIIIVAVIGIVFYLIYQNFLAETPTPEVSAVPLLKIKTGFALEILQDPKFSALVSHGKLPVVVSQKGKINPFMKF